MMRQCVNPSQCLTQSSKTSKAPPNKTANFIPRIFSENDKNSESSKFSLFPTVSPPRLRQPPLPLLSPLSLVHFMSISCPSLVHCKSIVSPFSLRCAFSMSFSRCPILMFGCMPKTLHLLRPLFLRAGRPERAVLRLIIDEDEYFAFFWPIFANKTPSEFTCLFLNKKLKIALFQIT